MHSCADIKEIILLYSLAFETHCYCLFVDMLICIKLIFVDLQILMKRLLTLNNYYMKKYSLSTILVICSMFIFGQAPMFQTYTADLLVIATKDGINQQWQNKDIRITLNYETGAFKTVINNSDFYNKETNSRIKENDISNDTEFIFEGNMPINQILNQKTINQDYDIELQLTNDDINFSEVINMKMNIMRPNQNSNSYRVFTLTGILYNDELNLPAFKGYDNEVEIRIIFNAFWTGQK